MTFTKPTASERRTLAILADRLTVGDQGKDRFRSNASDLARNNPTLVVNTKTGWAITAEGLKYAAKATPRGSNFARWAEEKKPGAGRIMADLLNSKGTDAGHDYLRELGIS
jgi:hypothetical protein